MANDMAVFLAGAAAGAAVIAWRHHRQGKAGLMAVTKLALLLKRTHPYVLDAVMEAHMRAEHCADNLTAETAGSVQRIADLELADASRLAADIQAVLGEYKAAPPEPGRQVPLEEFVKDQVTGSVATAAGLRAARLMGDEDAGDT